MLFFFLLYTVYSILLLSSSVMFISTLSSLPAPEFCDTPRFPVLRYVLEHAHYLNYVQLANMRASDLVPTI